MNSISINNQFILTKLRYRWLMTTIIWYAVLLAAVGQLNRVWAYADRWALIAGTMLAYNLWLLWSGLPANHREGESKLLSTFGLGNVLTLARGLAIALLTGFIASPWPVGWAAWLPMLLYLAFNITDLFDGYLARITNQATMLGAKLDMNFDGLGVLVVTLLAVSYGQLPGWYLIIGAARYFFVFALWWRKRQGLPIYELSPSIHRRAFAGFQMNVLSASLLPIAPAYGVTLAATIYAISTGYSFLRDWLVVSGRIDPTSPTYRKVQGRIFITTTKWLPPLLRLALVAAMLIIYSQLSNIIQPQEWVNLFMTWGLAFPLMLATVISVPTMLAVLGAGLGIMGRLASFWLILPIAFDIISHGLQWANAIALSSILCLILLGTGYFSLWVPKEKMFVRRMGSKN
jgi:CDP-diacylglycerol--glycerol-3-phosphate 3-phosphatidyltransferase